MTGFLVTMLGSCATTQKVAEAETPEDATSVLTKEGTTASGTYVDPMVTTAHARKLAQNAMPASGMRSPAGGKPAQNALTQMYPSAPTSIAGAVTEPTGVRAGSVSIFSGHGPAAAPATTMASAALDSPYPAASFMPAGGVNAMTRSVFSTGTPVACGNDANGNMISC